MRMLPVGAALIYTNTRKDRHKQRRTEMKKLIGASQNYANAAKDNINARFEVLTAVLIKSQVFCDMTPRCLVKRYGNFGGNFYRQYFQYKHSNFIVYLVISNMFRPEQSSAGSLQNQKAHNCIRMRPQNFTQIYYTKIYF